MTKVRFIVGLVLIATFLVGCGPLAAPGTTGDTPVPTTAPSLPEDRSGTAAPEATATAAEPTAEAEEVTPEPPSGPTEDVEPTPLRTLPTDPKNKPDFGTLSPPPVLPAHTPGTQVDAVKQATEDLARRLDVEIDQIQLVGVSPDEFPAGDLGCPGPGQTPLPNQGFVTGKSIVLEVDEARFVYRAHGGLVMFCGQR